MDGIAKTHRPMFCRASA